MMKRYFALMAMVLFSSLTFAQSFPKTLNITYVSAPFNLQNIVMKEKAMLEKEFAPEGVSINWIPIKGGINQVRGLASGTMDMVSAMNTSTLLMANASGNRILIADIIARPDEIFALVGKKSLRTVADLQGKRVVGPKGTVLHHLLVVALKEQGLSVDDVRFTSMNLPASLAALTTGHADAALLVGSAVLKTQAQGYPILVKADGLLNTQLVLAVSEAFAKRYPHVVNRVRNVNRSALAWIREHESEAIEIGARALKLTTDEAKILLKWANLDQGLTPQDIQTLENNQRFLIDQQMMKRSLDLQTLFFDGSMP